MSPEIKHCRTSVKLSLNNQKLPVQLVSTKVRWLYNCIWGISQISSGVNFSVLKQSTVWREYIESQQFSSAGQFVKSLVLINMNPLAIHRGYCWEAKILVITSYSLFHMSVFHMFAFCRMDCRERGSQLNAMFQWRVSGGFDWPLLPWSLYLEANNS